MSIGFYSSSSQIIEIESSGGGGGSADWSTWDGTKDGSSSTVTVSGSTFYKKALTRVDNNRFVIGTNVPDLTTFVYKLYAVSGANVTLIASVEDAGSTAGGAAMIDCYQSVSGPKLISLIMAGTPIGQLREWDITENEIVYNRVSNGLGATDLVAPSRDNYFILVPTSGGDVLFYTSLREKRTTRGLINSVGISAMSVFTWTAGQHEVIDAVAATEFSAGNTSLIHVGRDGGGATSGTAINLHVINTSDLSYVYSGRVANTKVAIGRYSVFPFIAHSGEETFVIAGDINNANSFPSVAFIRRTGATSILLSSVLTLESVQTVGVTVVPISRDRAFLAWAVSDALKGAVVDFDPDTNTVSLTTPVITIETGSFRTSSLHGIKFDDSRIILAYSDLSSTSFVKVIRV